MVYAVVARSLDLRRWQVLIFAQTEAPDMPDSLKRW